MRKNVTLNLGLECVNISSAEAGRLLIAVGKTGVQLNIPPIELVGQVTSDHWKVLAEEMLQAGIPPHDFNRVYEEGCGVLFGLWP